MQGGEGEAALSEQLSECLCVCSRLALHASQRQTEECSKEVACLVNMILAAVQQSVRIQKELASALKYKTSAKQVMEDMRAVIEQQRQIIRTSQEKTQSSASLQVIPVTADATTNTGDSYVNLVSENERLKRTVQELRGNMARLSAELHDSKVAREAQGTVLDMLYQEHQATVAKCAKLENSLKTMKAAVQQVLAPQHKRHHTRYHEGHGGDDFGSRSAGSRSSRRHDKPSRHSLHPQYTPPRQENLELEAEVAERRGDHEEEQSRRSETTEDRGRADEEPADIDEQSPLVVQVPTVRRVEGIAMIEARPTHRYPVNDEDENEDEDEEELSALAAFVLSPSHDVDQELKPTVEQDDEEDGDQDEDPSQESSHCSDEISLQEEDSLEELGEDKDDQHEDEGEGDAEGEDDDDEVLSARSDEDERDDSVEELPLSPTHQEDQGNQLDDASSSQDRPDDSIAQMQRFYSSLLIDDMLP